MNIKNLKEILSDDFELDAMQTKDAKYFLNYLEDNYHGFNNYLKSNNILFNFVNYFLSNFVNLKSSYITSGIDQFDAKTIALEETITQMNDFINDNISSAKNSNDLEKYDLDVVNFIDSDKID